MMDSFSVAVSIALQHGVPLQTYVEKFTNLRFEPAGLTDDPDVRMSSSIMDYVFRRLALDHLSFEERSALGIYSAEERTRELETGSYLPAEDDSEDVEEELENLAQSAPSTPAQPEVVQPLTTGHATSQLPVVNVSGPPRRSRRRPRCTPRPSCSRRCRAARPTPDVLHLRHEDAPGRFLLRLRGLRQHLRLQLTCPDPTRGGAERLRRRPWRVRTHQLVGASGTAEKGALASGERSPGPWVLPADLKPRSPAPAPACPPIR